ncbi:MAG: hypothetical protein BGP20_12485 [Thiobacillus sp. 63-78]|uniref:hypothetical protein n=1 Tax=Thiobacillus sp. 63-78 TaxID=1895859 RepID=UPI0009662310|nr:hypothetical protein [Thiobacillus sp. 63-78]MBN8762865.1 hypothetical protein [Thiobacillus sp.]MBN8773745.1 hypothetical protein [Thiobacillus sp.]OJZ05224.1 MAG: hypothetical protein BGP20_12485 [Thiobacillus sp. 63-78]
MSRFDWKKHYLQGDISFADALLFYLQEAGAPEFLIGAYEGALQKYQDGDVSDLAEPFGIAMKKREKNAENRKTWVSHVRFHVDAYAEQNFPKTDPGKYENTAFHKAGKLLNKSPSQIYDTYYGK